MIEMGIIVLLMVAGGWTLVLLGRERALTTFLSHENNQQRKAIGHARVAINESSFYLEKMCEVEKDKEVLAVREKKRMEILKANVKVMEILNEVSVV